MKYTKQEVIRDLKAEFEGLSARNYSLSGDVNYKEHGGVRYRNDGSGGIFFIIYIGLSNLPEKTTLETSMYRSCTDLDDLIEGLDAVWDFSDGENCGFDIGFLISSLQAYNGSLV